MPTMDGSGSSEALPTPTMSADNETREDALRQSQKDANDVVWILTSSFLIFTMQSGYGLLESGVVSRKNEVNILIKNATNVLIGGLAYWIYGYSLSFGPHAYPLIATGAFFTQAKSESEMGLLYAQYVFQFAYATTSSTFISGAMAERCKFTAYCIFALVNVFIYSVPSGWMWRTNGYLHELGSVDIGGAGIVHLVGGFCGLMGALILGPRTGRYDRGNEPLPMGNPTNALLGLFMLWWGWLGFSAGSTFGIVNDKWKFSSRAAVTTIMASMGGGFIGMSYSFIVKRGLHDVGILMDAVMASLVAVSGGAPIFRPWEAIFVGCIAALIVLLVIPIVDWAHIDDPTNCFAVHGMGGLWGLLAIGLFPERDYMRDYTRGRNALFKGGGWEMLGAQAAAAGCLIMWSTLVSAILLLLLKYTIGIRMTIEEEILGPDYVDHALKHDGNARVIEAVQKRSQFVQKRQGILDVMKSNVRFNMRRKKVNDTTAVLNRRVLTK